MFLLHKTPVLTRKAIRRTLTGNSPVTACHAASSDGSAGRDPADQIEQIKLTPQTMNTEELRTGRRRRRATAHLWRTLLPWC